MAYLPHRVERRGWARRSGAGMPILLALVAGGAAAGVGVLPRSLQMLALEGAIFIGALALVRDIRRVLLACVIADTALGLDRYLDYRPDLAAVGATAGLAVSLTTGVIGVLWFLELASPSRRRETSAGTRALRLALLAYGAAVILSFRVAPDRSLALNELAVLAPAILVAFYLMRTVVRRRDVELVLSVMFVMAVLEGLLALTLGGGIRDNTYGPLHVMVVEAGRFSGTFLHPNIAGAYLELVFVPAIAVAASPARAGLRRLAFAAAAFSGIAIILTFSRGAWIAVGLSGMIFAISGVRRGWFSARAPVILSLCALACTAPLIPSISTRIMGGDAGSTQSRFDLARVAERIIRDHPLFGVGANNYAIGMRDYRTPDVSGTWDYVVHNKYLLVWGETGAIGLLAFVAILVIALRAGMRASHSRDRATAMMAVGLTAALAGSMAHMLVDTFHGRPATTNLLIVAALLAALSGIAASEKRHGMKAR